MSPDRISSVGSREHRIAAFADEIRADVANALCEGCDVPTQHAAFQQLRGLAAKLHSCVDRRPKTQIDEIFAADAGPRTPLLGVALVFNDQRHGLMLLAHGEDVGVNHRMVDPAMDHEAAARELARHLIPGDEVVPLSHGVCDSISAGLAMPHTFFIVYAVDVTLLDAGSLNGTLVKASDLDEAAFDPLTRFMLGGAARDVLDSPFALTAEVRDVVEDIRDCAGSAATDPRLARVADTAQSILDGVGSRTELARGDFAYLDATTPRVGAEGIIVDHEERMLLCRDKADSAWSIPAGRCEVGESSAATVVRVAADALDVEVEIGGLAGVFDNRLMGVTGQSYDVCFVYAGRKLRAIEAESNARAVETYWCPMSELGEIALAAGQRERIGAALQALSG